MRGERISGNRQTHTHKETTIILAHAQRVNKSGSLITDLEAMGLLVEYDIPLK